MELEFSASLFAVSLTVSCYNINTCVITIRQIAILSASLSNSCVDMKQVSNNVMTVIESLFTIMYK